MSRIALRASGEMVALFVIGCSFLHYIAATLVFPPAALLTKLICAIALAEFKPWGRSQSSRTPGVNADEF